MGLTCLRGVRHIATRSRVMRALGKILNTINYIRAPEFLNKEICNRFVDINEGYKDLAWQS